MVTDKEFLEKEWLQNCGDYVIVLKKSNKQDKWKEFLWEINYKLCPLKENELRRKSEVISGRCFNKNLSKKEEEKINKDEIKLKEFMSKRYLQNCGDTLEILDTEVKTRINKNGNKVSKRFFRCKFINVPCEVISDKWTIEKGRVNNPEKEIKEFVGKRFKQHCNDTLTVLEKTNILDKSSHTYYWKVKFDHFDYICLATKGRILVGEVENKNIPWKDKQLFKNFCNNLLTKLNTVILNFEEIYQQYFEWSITKAHFFKKICDYGLIDIFDKKLFVNFEQSTLEDFIKKIYDGKIIINFQGTKEQDLKELDIYLPQLNIAFEYNGTYWHNLQEERTPGYHKKKFDTYLKNGIIIFNIWDWFWFDDLNDKYKSKNHHIREEAKMYINNIINCYQKCLVNKF